ncbi:Uncharacterised protein [Bordetella ansorpii]|uniref:Uncharacterized protein n=1 Tax=Bordetella ansorpii TaxID=288768 RepID=A0A157S9D8_9BORD|nr:hypothetical protein [Bordetella ansorpii]SAI67048.1 Uncharacterised protein [Bordetella ansorpii]
MSSRPTTLYRSVRNAIPVVTALALAAATFATAQETPHQSTPPERHMPEPVQNGGPSGQNMQNTSKDPGDRMAPASKVEGKPQQSNNNEATQQDVQRKEQQEKPASPPAAPSGNGQAPKP